LKTLVLVSKSPRRQEILKRLNIPFDIIEPIVDETPLAKENPYKYVIRISKLKAEYAFSDKAVIAADTIVYKKRIYGKPRNEKEAFEMIKRLSGKKHKVITGVTIINKEGVRTSFYVQTKVVFDKIGDKQIKEYIKTKESYDKAGGYAIQGEAAKFIKKINGCYYNVMGFPLNKINKMLLKMNISK